MLHRISLISFFSLFLIGGSSILHAQQKLSRAEKQLVKLVSANNDEAIAFLDNGGSPSGTPEYCNYCKGKRDASSSDNPQKAIISLKNDRETPYSTYITVQNELVAAYNDLRNREARRLYGRDFTEMESEYLNPETPSSVRDELKEKVQRIQELFPQKLSEAETTKI
jgi:hypothetical protein